MPFKLKVKDRRVLTVVKVVCLYLIVSISCSWTIFTKLLMPSKGRSSWGLKHRTKKGIGVVLWWSISIKPGPWSTSSIRSCHICPEIQNMTPRALSERLLPCLYTGHFAWQKSSGRRRQRVDQLMLDLEFLVLSTPRLHLHLPISKVCELALEFLPR